jgi:hypothetical protein
MNASSAACHSPIPREISTADVRRGKGGRATSVVIDAHLSGAKKPAEARLEVCHAKAGTEHIPPSILLHQTPNASSL